MQYQLCKWIFKKSCFSIYFNFTPRFENSRASSLVKRPVQLCVGKRRNQNCRKWLTWMRKFNTLNTFLLITFFLSSGWTTSVRVFLTKSGHTWHCWSVFISHVYVTFWLQPGLTLSPVQLPFGIRSNETVKTWLTVVRKFSYTVSYELSRIL